MNKLFPHENKTKQNISEDRKSVGIRTKNSFLHKIFTIEQIDDIHRLKISINLLIIPYNN